MAAPTLKKVIGVEVKNANAGETVIIRNNTTGAQVSGQLNSGKGVVFNEAWNEGDELVAEIRGSVTGFKVAKVQIGGADIKITTASSDTSSPGVSL